MCAVSVRKCFVCIQIKKPPKNIPTFLTFCSELQVLGTNASTSEMRQPNNHTEKSNNNFAKNQARSLSVTENHDRNSFEIALVFPEIDLGSTT